ncbi:YDG domain-containing protein [Fimbriiglobus ruber]|uniref:Flagellar hook-length control protein FliK n=1 Tax=Fimbriiglobus ruber TaxID=1908690 RepID=A0A225DWM3_9BACT|nr:YDG domain-containing protein [Fimbriiglobus ruber]OWK43984.1 Flagellar hook-length control protein FliK [Fimbriiglobus ruber]
MTGNAFDGTVYVQPAYVPLLANNTSFQDVDLNSGSSIGSTPLNLPVLGGSSTLQRYVISSLTGYNGTSSPFTIAAGATVNFLANTSVAIADNDFTGSVVVDGTLTVTDPASFAAQFTVDHTDTDSITVASGGTMVVTDTNFTTTGSQASSGTSLLQVDSGGIFNMIGGSFEWTSINLLAGATSTLQYMLLTGQLAINNAATINITDNDFSGLPANAIVASGSTSVNILLPDEYWGTSLDSEIRTHIVDHVSNPTTILPTVVYSPPPVLSDRPVRPAGEPVPPVPYNPNAGHSVNLTADLSTTIGQVTSGTVTFTLLQGTTVIGTSVQVNVTSQTVVGSYFIPAGTAGGSYVVEIQYSDGTDVFTDESQTLVINPIGQTITFNPPTPVTFAAGLTVNLAATSDSGLTVSYTVISGPATVSGNVLTVTGGGSVVIQATQAGNNNYTTATAVQQTLVIDPATQTITFNPPAPVTFAAGLTVNLAATSSSGLTIGYTVVSGPATVSGNVLTITGGGSVVIQATQAGDADYVAATAVEQTLVVNPASQSITFTTPTPVTYATGLTVNLAATSSSGLTVGYTVVSGPATVSGNVLTVTGAGSVVIQAIQAGDADYAAATAVQQTLVVNPASQTITFTPPAPVNFSVGLTVNLAATSSSGLTVGYTVLSGPATVAGNVLTVTGVGSVVIQATQAGDADYAAATTVEQTLVVNAAAQTITFNPPAPVTFAAGLTVNLAATSSSGLTVSYTVVSGPATVSGNVLTVTGGGNVVIQATQAGDADFAAATAVQQTLVVNPASQTITFTTPAPVTFAAGLTVNLAATSDSGLTVSYTVVSGPATVSGNVLTVTGGGSVVIQATQAGNADFAAATAVQQTLVVNPASQTITFTTPAPVTFAVGLTVNLAATSSSGLTVSYTVISGPATVSGNVLTVTGAGSVVIQAIQAGDADFTAATAVQQTLVVNQGAQTITFTPPAPVNFAVGLTVNLAATSSSGLTVSYTVVSGPATVSGNVLTVTGIGSVVIQATQAGDADFTAATAVQQTLVVNAAAQTITFNPPAPVTFAAGLTVNLAATSSSGLTVGYTVISGPATVSGNVLTVTGGGSVVIQATQAGDADFAAATPVQQTLVVNPASQTITFTPPAPVTFAVGLTVNLAATSSSGLTVGYTVVSGPATVSGNVLTVTGGGSVVIQATQAGDADFAAATAVQRTLVVNPASQTITFTTLAPVNFAVGLTVNLAATSSSGLTVSYTVISGPATVSGNVLTITGIGSVVIQAIQAGDADFAAATAVQQTLVVNQGAQTITFTPPAPVNFAVGLTVNLAATSSSGLTVGYTVVSGPATVSGNVLTVTGGGSVVIQATQAGDANFTAATAVQQTLVVNPAAQTITFTPLAQVTFAIGLTVNLTATGGASGDAVTFTVISGPATVSGNVLTVTGAGSVVIQADQASDADYAAATAVQQTLVVNAAAQTITFAPLTAVTYAAGLTVNLAATGGGSGNAVTFTVVSGPATVSGNVLTVTGAGSVVIQANQAGDTDYAAAAAVHQSLVVNPIVLTVTGITVVNRAYNGTSSATLETAGAGLVGVVNGDSVTLVATGATATFSSVDVGTGISVAVSGLALSGPQAANYVLTQPTGVTASITPATLTVTGITAANRVYNRTTGATVSTTVATLAGVLGGDAVALVTAGATGTFTNPDVGTGITVDVSGLALTGAKAGDYTLTEPTTTADITPAPLTVAGITAVNRTYDRTTAATVSITGAALVGVLGGDAVTLVATGATGTFAIPQVGIGIPVAVAGLTLGGAQAGDYTLTQPATTANITPAPLTVAGLTANDRAYNHTPAATLSTAGATLVGVFAGDTVTLVATGASGTFTSADVGTGIPVTVAGLTLGGAQAGEYVLVQPTAAASITPAPLTVTGVTAQNKVGDGTTLATLDTAGATLTGTFPGDAVTLDASGATGTFASPNPGTGIAVTVSGLKLTGPQAADYALSQPSVSANITSPTVPPTVPPAVPPTVPPAVPPTVPPAVPPSVPPGTPNPALVGYSQIAVGEDAGGTGTVTVYNADQSVAYTATPFGASFTAGVRVAVADLNDDGVPDLIAGTGPGVTNQVVVLDGKTHQQLASFSPFETTFTGGVFVTVGDVNGDGVPDLIVTPDQSGGPIVAVYDGASLGQGKVVQLARFFGIADPSFRGGARAAVGDINGDGYGDVIVSAGYGGGPRIAIYDGKSVAAGAPTELMPDFFAFESSLRNGAYVTAGDLTGKGYADLIFGAGPGGGPRVRVVDSAALLAAGDFQSLDDASVSGVGLADFFAGDPSNRGGVRVAIADLDGSTQASLVVGSGQGAGATVTTYIGKAIVANPDAPVSTLNFDAEPGFTGGVFVG